MSATDVATDTIEPAVAPSDRADTYLRRYLQALTRGKGLAGLGILLAIVLLGLVGPLLLPHDAFTQSSGALAGPSTTHLLGTDEVGRDVLARVLVGIRLDLLICLVAVPLSAGLGTLLGLIGGLSRFAGEAFQRVFDVLLGFPGIILGIAVSLVIGAGFGAIVAAIVLTTIPIFGRQARSALLSQMSRDYVTAAEVIGVPKVRVLIRHVLPNVLDAVLTLVAVVMASAIKIEGGLSVVGLGIQPPTPSLGAMISSGSTYVFQSPLYALSPVVFLAGLVFAFTLISDSLNKTGLRS